MAVPHDRMGHQSTEHAHGHGAVVSTETASVREPFGISQIVCLITGILFVVLGAVGLARTGFGSLTEPQTDVGGIGSTPLLALIHLGIGVVALIGAASRSGSRGTSLFIGPLLIAAGLVALIEPIDALGFDTANGAVYLIVGVIAIVAALMTPVVAVEDRRYTAV